MAKGEYTMEKPFWQIKSLEEMDRAEWESLCDGCARCCLNKLEDWDTGKIEWTSVRCTLLDDQSCRCSDYANRFDKVEGCVNLTPETVRSIDWLPPSCAYRLVAEGRDLYWWHPLLSGDPATVHAAGIAVGGRTVSEDDLDLEDFEDYIVQWPNRIPAAARAESDNSGHTRKGRRDKKKRVDGVDRSIRS